MRKVYYKLTDNSYDVFNTNNNSLSLQETLPFGVEYRKPPMSSDMSATYAPSRPSNFEDNSYRSNYG